MLFIFFISFFAGFLLASACFPPRSGSSLNLPPHLGSVLWSIKPSALDTPSGFPDSELAKEELPGIPPARNAQTGNASCQFIAISPPLAILSISPPMVSSK